MEYTVDCSWCGKRTTWYRPYVPYVLWKGEIVGECCYHELVKSLTVESITGDESLLYDYEGVFSDSDHNRYKIRQQVTAGFGNMGIFTTLSIEEL